MIAVLLCAGYATRLYPLTRDFPKPLLPVADRPVIDYLVDQIQELPEIRSLHVVTNARFFSQFGRWADNKKASAAKAPTITVHNDGTSNNAGRLGAVGDLHFVLSRLNPTDPMLVSAADNIFRFPIADIWQQFLIDQRHRVIALPETDPAKLHRTGVLALGDEDRVLRLHEKPTTPPSTWSCPPLYFLQPSAIQHLAALRAAGSSLDAPGHFIDFLCRREAVVAQKVDGSRLDIGDLQGYQLADQILRRDPVLI